MFDLHPLSTFPALFDYMLFGPTLLRLVLGGIVLTAGIRLCRNTERGTFVFESLGLRPGRIYSKIAAVVEMLAGMLVFIGFYMQPAAAVIALVALVGLFAHISKPDIIRSNVTHFILLLTIALSLLVMGPGLLAFDLPL